VFPPLSNKERDNLLKFATQEQVSFMMSNVKQSRKSIFLNVIAEQKVTIVRSTDISLGDVERDINQWHLEQYTDYGEGNLLGKCACGRRLRRVFTLKHDVTGKVIDYGEEHFKQFLGIDSKILRELVNGFNVIDLEFDELLIKISENNYCYDLLEVHFKGMEIPTDIQQHINANVPLLDTQIARLYIKLREMERELRNVNDEAYRLALLEERRNMEKQIQAERERLNNVISSVKKSLPYNASKEEIAYQLVLHEFNSTLEICHILIDFFGIDGLLSAGTHQRPRIYYDILFSFKKHEAEGNLIMTKKIEYQDCLFKMNKNEQKQISGDGQLTLLL
jgi:hypothetical protein